MCTEDGRTDDADSRNQLNRMNVGEGSDVDELETTEHLLRIICKKSILQHMQSRYPGTSIDVERACVKFSDLDEASRRKAMAWLLKAHVFYLHAAFNFRCQLPTRKPTWFVYDRYGVPGFTTDTQNLSISHELG